MLRAGCYVCSKLTASISCNFLVDSTLKTGCYGYFEFTSLIIYNCLEDSTSKLGYYDALSLFIQPVPIVS